MTEAQDAPDPQPGTSHPPPGPVRLETPGPVKLDTRGEGTEAGDPLTDQMLLAGVVGGLLTLPLCWLAFNPEVPALHFAVFCLFLLVVGVVGLLNVLAGIFVLLLVPLALQFTPFSALSDHFVLLFLFGALPALLVAAVLGLVLAMLTGAYRYAGRPWQVAAQVLLPAAVCWAALEDSAPGTAALVTLLGTAATLLSRRFPVAYVAPLILAAGLSDWDRTPAAPDLFIFLFLVPVVALLTMPVRALLERRRKPATS